MAIEHILEHDIKVSWSGWTTIAIKTKTNVHCSCGKDYLIKNKFKETRTGEKNYTRPSKCPKCKEISYLDYSMTISKDEDNDLHCHSKIAPNKIIGKKN